MDPLVTPGREPQSAGAVLMVRPARFGFNPDTAASNAFQSADGAGIPAGAAERHDLARREFDNLANRLALAGVDVIVGEDTPTPAKPDAVFPNNWVSFHRDGTVVLYPMLAHNRRAERRDDLIGLVSDRGYAVARTVDLRHREALGQYLEGTGSVVLDRVQRVAYAAISPRTDLNVLGEFSQLLDYALVTFDARDAGGRAIYHTNVIMSVGTRFAVLCSAAVADHVHRGPVAMSLRAGGHEVIELSMQQMARFGANILELSAASGPIIALSASAWESYDPAQRRRLEAHGQILVAQIPVIERLGGGSVRCMLAEIHLPKRSG